MGRIVILLFLVSTSLFSQRSVVIDSQTDEPKHAPLQASEYGFKSWDWKTLGGFVEDNDSSTNIANNTLVVDVDGSNGMIEVDGNKMKFHVVAESETDEWASGDGNFRSEIRTNPWLIQYPLGTEQWFGWTYEFADSYVFDPACDWHIFQIHSGRVGESPMIALMVTNSGQYAWLQDGELYVSNYAETSDEDVPGTPNFTDRAGTGIVPKAGMKLNIVAHIIWSDDDSTGLLQFWINGKSVYDKNIRTVTDLDPYGGNAKWGIYKAKWRNQSDIDASELAGVTEVETYIGNLYEITRSHLDPDNNKKNIEDYNKIDPSRYVD